MIRDILNYQGTVIGQLEMPDDTPEERWTEELAKYAVAPKSPSEIQASYLRNTIKQRKEYAEDLLERLKQKNITEGINVYQGLWMHHRMRALPITVNGVGLVQDVMNMAVSGDIEIACVTLQYAQPDDMSQSYHWWTQDRINWLIADMKNYLGWS
jgi:hypothetical protein